MASVPTIHSSNMELRNAARAIAWRDGVSAEVMESIVAKVTSLADRQRMVAFLRDPDNDDGGGG